MRPNDKEISLILETASKSFFASDLIPVLQQITKLASLKELDKIPYAINLFCSKATTLSGHMASTYLYASVPALILNHYWNRMLPSDLYGKLLLKYLEEPWRKCIREAAYQGNLSDKVKEIESILYAK